MILKTSTHPWLCKPLDKDHNSNPERRTHIEKKGMLNGYFDKNKSLPGGCGLKFSSPVRGTSRGIRLTITIVLFAHTLMQLVARSKLHNNCNLPSESSRDLNWGWQQGCKHVS